jgi:hypothetical protein
MGIKKNMILNQVSLNNNFNQSKIICSFKFKVIILLFLILFLPNLVSATKFYVAPYGYNQNPGTFNEPWKNLSYATQKVSAGDTIYLINGTWYNEICSFKSSGDSTQPITIDAFNGTPIFIGNVNSISSKFMKIKNKRYINVNNLTIKDYYYGIEVLHSENINIQRVTINQIQAEAVYFRDSNYSTLRDSGIFNVTGGGNSVGIVVADYINGTHDVNIINNTIAHNTKHNAIDLFNAAHNDSYYIKDVNIINNTIYDIVDCAIYTHGEKPLVMYRVSIVNNTAYDCYALHSSRLQDSIVSDNKIYNMRTHGITASVPINNVTFDRNIVFSNGAEDIFITTDNGSALLKKNNCSSYRSDGRGNVTILDPLAPKNKFSVKCANSASVNVKYNDNTIFDVTSTSKPEYYEINEPIYYPSSSSAIVKVNENTSVYPLFNFNIYPITAKPACRYITIKVNKFDTSLPPGNIIISLTVKTISENSVIFDIGDLHPNSLYLINRDNVNLTSTKANSLGHIILKNSMCSGSHDFILEEISCPSNQSTNCPLGYVKWDVNKESIVNLQDVNIFDTLRNLFKDALSGLGKPRQIDHKSSYL